MEEPIKLVKNEAELYFGFLLLIMTADGCVNDKELDFILSAIHYIGVDPQTKQIIETAFESAKKGTLPSDDFEKDIFEGLSFSKNNSFILNLIKDSFSLSSVDDNIAPQEEKLIKQLISVVLYDTSDTEVLFLKFKEWVAKALAVENEGLSLISPISKGS